MVHMVFFSREFELVPVSDANNGTSLPGWLSVPHVAGNLDQVGIRVTEVD
jgi:hypothetical protein